MSSERRAFGIRCTVLIVIGTLLLGSMWLVRVPMVARAAASSGGYGWGNNQTGEVDDGTTLQRSEPRASIGLSGVTTMSAGLWHCLAIRSNGTVIAWGHNASGELGDGSKTDASRPVGVVGLSNVSHVSSGGSFSLAVRSNGQVLAWGHNASGELGNGGLTDSSTPVQVSGLGAGSHVVAVSAGNAFALALKSDGTVLAWGNNASGELGNGTSVDSPVPVQVNGLGAGSGVVAVSAGTAFSLALKSDGTVLAWGNNASGELGNGDRPTDSSKPVKVTGLGSGSGVRAISTGGAFALALRSDGTVLAWGNNSSGELGNGKAPTSSQVPFLVPGLHGIKQVSAGYTHALALGAGNAVYAWGDNALGQIGNGTTKNATRPVRVAGLGDRQVLGVYAGGDHSHVLLGATAPKPSVSPSPKPSPKASASPSTTVSPKPSHTASPTPSSKPDKKPSPLPSTRAPPTPLASPVGTATPVAIAIAGDSGTLGSGGGSGGPIGLMALVVVAGGLLLLIPFWTRRRRRLDPAGSGEGSIEPGDR